MKKTGLTETEEGFLRIFLRAVVLVAFASLPFSYVNAQTMEDRCDAATDNNASYNQCLSKETSKVVAEMSRLGVDVICNGTTCVHRVVYDKTSNKYLSKELSVEIKPAEAGRDYVITDAKKRITIYSQCGTCRFIEHDTGPLVDVTIRPDTDATLMVTVRGRQR